MKLFLFLLSIFFTNHCLAQSASFKEIKLKPNSKFYRSKEPTIIYPIITTHNSKVDSLINSIVNEELFEAEAKHSSIQNVLKKYIDGAGLIHLGYEVTFNQFNVLSFSLFVESCGAYCSSSNLYFNFDLATGKSIEIENVILPDKIDSFKAIVQTEKISALRAYKTTEKTDWLNNEIDSTTYEWVITEISDNCINSIFIDQFSISGHSLEIMDPCDFPHAIRSQTPDYKLKYNYATLEPFLTPRFKKLLQ